MSTPITLSATTAVGQLYELCNVLSSYNFYAMGGSIIENIQTLPNALLSLTDQFNFTTEPSTEPLPAIPDYNRVVVNTFERYLFHYSSILWASLENKRNKNDAINLITTNVETAINFRLEMTVYSVEPSTSEPTLEVYEFSGINTIDLGGGNYGGIVGTIPKTGKLQKIAIFKLSSK